MKELIFYSSIYSYSAERFVEAVGKVPTTERMKVRVNSGGGETSSGLSMLSRIHEMPLKPDAVVDGQAMSMMAFMLPFFNKVIANNTSRFMFHKAAYPTWYDASESQKKALKAENANFRKMLEKRVLSRVGGQEFIDEVFEADVRNDVELTAEKALALGLVDEVRTLEPAASFSSEKDSIHFNGDDGIVLKKEPEASSTNINTENKMTYTQEQLDKAVATAVSTAKAAEIQRVAAWMVYSEVDAEAMKKGIADPEATVTPAIMAEMSLKATKAGTLANHKTDSAGDAKVDPKANPETEPTAEEKEKADFDLAMNKRFEEVNK